MHTDYYSKLEMDCQLIMLTIQYIEESSNQPGGWYIPQEVKGVTYARTIQVRARAVGIPISQTDPNLTRVSNHVARYAISTWYYNINYISNFLP